MGWAEKYRRISGHADNVSATTFFVANRESIREIEALEADARRWRFASQHFMENMAAVGFGRYWQFKSPIVGVGDTPE